LARDQKRTISAASKMRPRGFRGGRVVDREVESAESGEGAF